MILPLLTCLWVTPALADEPTENPSVLPYLSVGGIELIQVAPGGPARLGFFAMMQLDLLFPVGDSRWTLISSSGFEMAPENGNWGFYQFVVFDYQLSQVGSTVVTLEPQMGLVHNAVPSENEISHALYPTVGIGMAFLSKEGAGPGIIPTVTASHGLQGEGLSMGAMALFTVPIN